MLTNYSTLGYSLTKGEPTSYINMPKLQEIPELGSDPEKVDVTCLSDSVKKYEMGIGDLAELSYTFLVDNPTKESDVYRVMKKAQEEGTEVYFKQSTRNGEISVTFSGNVNVKLSGGGINSPLQFTLSIALKSDFVFAYGSAS